MLFRQPKSPGMREMISARASVGKVNTNVVNAITSPRCAHRPVLRHSINILLVGTLDIVRWIRPPFRPRRPQFSADQIPRPMRGMVADDGWPPKLAHVPA